MRRHLESPATALSTSRVMNARTAAILLATVSTASIASAQERVEISPFFGYQVGGGVTSFPGRLDVDADTSYGVFVDLRVRPDATIQLLYDRQDTVLSFRSSDPFSPTQVSAGLSIEYFHFGGTVEFSEESLRPYFALTVGATRFDPAPAEFGDEWRFSIGFGGGVKTFLSNRVGLRLDGRVWPTFLNTRGGFFCSLPGGCLVSIEADLVYQANATVGFFFVF
ncbi:MAG TPA: outer membrane beta-barrel protein [Vicinamibacteria bacterium]|nr:outer membrane beta-barrel protein [Vicinamibacteria bacterium]